MKEREKKMKMELKLVSTKELSNRFLNVYRIGEYEVRLTTCKTSGRSIDVYNKGDRFTPDIYYRVELVKEKFECAFYVQTTSYGGLTSEETKQLISKLETATNVVDILTQEFILKGGQQ